MTRFKFVFFALVAALGAVALFAGPVPITVDETTGEVLTPLVADATSNKRIAVFHIPMGQELPMFNWATSGSITMQLPRDFELKIYKQATSANTSAVTTAAKVFWYHSPNNVLSGQVLPNGLPPGYFLGGDHLGGDDGANKTFYKIRHSTITSLSDHRPAAFVFTGVVIYVDTAGTDYELLNNCFAMYCRYSATESEALTDDVDGRAWHPIIPSAWVREIPTFID